MGRNGHGLLMHAIRTSWPDGVRQAVEAGANVNGFVAAGRGLATRGTALMLAAVDCDAETVAALLAEGADAGVVNEDGRTALMLAARRGRAGVAGVLVGGGHIDSRGIDGRTALMLAAEEGYGGCVNILLVSGANAKIADAKGLTALMLAAGRGSVACVASLVEGSDALATDLCGNTARTHAMAGGFKEVVEFLMSVEEGAVLDSELSRGPSGMGRASL